MTLFLVEFILVKIFRILWRKMLQFLLESLCLKEVYFLSLSKGLFTWSGGPRSSGVGFFCFHALEDTKQKKLTPLDHRPGSPTPCKQGLNLV